MDTLRAHRPELAGDEGDCALDLAGRHDPITAADSCRFALQPDFPDLHVHFHVQRLKANIWQFADDVTDEHSNNFRVAPHGHSTRRDTDAQQQDGYREEREPGAHGSPKKTVKIKRRSINLERVLDPDLKVKEGERIN